MNPSWNKHRCRLLQSLLLGGCRVAAVMKFVTGGRSYQFYVATVWCADSYSLLLSLISRRICTERSYTQFSCSLFGALMLIMIHFVIKYYILNVLFNLDPTLQMHNTCQRHWRACAFCLSSCIFYAVVHCFTAYPSSLIAEWHTNLRLHFDHMTILWPHRIHDYI